MQIHLILFTWKREYSCVYKWIFKKQLVVVVVVVVVVTCFFFLLMVLSSVFLCNDSLSVVCFILAPKVTFYFS